MKGRILEMKIAGIALAMLLSCLPAEAYAAGQPKRVAYLVGNWDYNGNGSFDDKSPNKWMLNDLWNPCHDVSLISAQLKARSFEVRQEDCNLSKKGFRDQVAAIEAEAKTLPDGSILLIYYSGHGMQIGGINYQYPVTFKWPPGASKMRYEDRFKFFNQNTNNVNVLLEALKKTERRKFVSVVLLDMCRDSPYTKVDLAKGSDGPDESAVRQPPYNVLVQYSTTAKNVAFDGEGNNSIYAQLLAEHLAKGGDLLTSINAIQTTTFNANPEQYAPMSPGGFILGNPFSFGESMKQVAVTTPAPPTPLRKVTAAPHMVATKSAELPTTPDLVRRKLELKSGGDGYTLQVFWCEGTDEKTRFADAYELAAQVAGNGEKFGVGRVLVQPLSEEKNENDGYNVRNYNLLRVDSTRVRERAIADSVASAFPDFHLMTVPGLGVGGKPTPYSVSAFVCNPRTEH